jgi:hypothetical protein
MCAQPDPSNQGSSTPVEITSPEPREASGDEQESKSSQPEATSADPLDHGPEHWFTVTHRRLLPGDRPGGATANSPEGSARDAVDWIKDLVTKL